MISREVNINKKFRLAKEHSISYINHYYCNIDIMNNMLESCTFEQDKWDGRFLKIIFELIF